jgi:hypothetical protein
MADLKIIDRKRYDHDEKNNLSASCVSDIDDGADISADRRGGDLFVQ